MVTINKNYNYCLDFMKGMACLFVVWMHCEFPGKIGIIVQAISRFCVPFFFMVSGYFSGNMGVGKYLVINKKTKHIFIITIWATIFYIVWFLVSNLLWDNKNISVSITQIAIWLIFNQPVIISGHLWFLFALLYDYILVSIFDSKRIHNQQYKLGAIVLVLLFILGQGCHLLGIQIPIPEFVRNSFGHEIPQFANIPNFVYRNWLIEGLAFFMLGRWIKENKDKISVKNTTLLIIIAVSTILCLFERQIMGRDFGVNICTLPQVTALFLYSVKNPELHAGFLQRIGRNCSMMVYILHMFVWDIVAKIYYIIGISNNIIAQYLLPIVVVFISIILALMFNWIISMFSKENNKVLS